MKHPAPRSSSSSSFHFEAARDARLMLPWCESCSRHHWPARASCPHCHNVGHDVGDGGQVSWREARGTGRIASYSIVVRAVNPELKDDAPYVVGFVELDDGVRLFTNIVDAKPEQLHCGQRVQCRFEATLDPELWVPVFAPVESPGELTDT